MNKRVKLFALPILFVAGPAAAYYLQSPSSNPLADELRSFALRPINPPSTLVEVGSLYRVSEDGGDFQLICPADAAEVAALVKKSRSVQIEQDLNRHGSFATDMSINLQHLFQAGVANNYAQKVHYSLTDVTIEEIALESNKQIQSELMGNSRCSDAVLEQLKYGAFVCQPQKILLATMEFKLDGDSQNKINTRTDIAPGKVNKELEVAIKTQSDQSVVERDGRVYSGSALNFGVEVNPTCIAPPHSHFLRVLPWSSLDRLVNFVSDRMVEPWLPPTPDLPPVVAQAARSETK